jgi:uncharacterized protein (TIGR03435 family)
MKLRQSALALAVAISCLSLAAQPPQPAVEFEVASIKPNKSGSDSSGTNSNKGMWRATNVTVRNLIINAYDVLTEQVVGAPSWIDSERFDIEARYDEAPSLNRTEEIQAQRMRLQALLASRFQFQIHRETKEWQAYALVSGKKGPKLTPTERKGDGSSMRASRGHREWKGVNMDNLSHNLARRLGRPVVNETGLEGRFDFTLDFEPEGQAVRMSDKSNPIGSGEPTLPSLFTAVQDQLGLKLESRKVQVELLVVEKVERPSEN